MSISGLLHHTIAGRALEGLTNLQKNGNSTETHTGAQGPVNGPDTLTPPSPKTDGSGHHDNGWQQNGPGGAHHGGPETGNPLPQGPSGMQTGGPAPQGLQDVLPNIAQQLASSLASVVDGLGSLTRTTLAAPVQVPGAPLAAQAAANALAHSAPAAANAQAAAQQAILGAAAPNTVATATPATVAATAAASQAVTPNVNPAAPTLAQPTSTMPGTVSDTSALMQNRAVETLPPRLDNASLLSRMASALPPGSTTSSNATLPTPPPGLTQAMTAAGLTMATAAVNQPVDARGAILAANDAAAMRADNALTLAGHTLDGLQRRSMRNRVQLLPQRMTRLLWALGLMGTQASEQEPNPERELQRAMQWLFWMLAVIAYGCLAVAIVALVGSNSRMFDYEASRSYTGWLAFFGLLTGTVAWLLAKRMSRR